MSYQVLARKWRPRRFAELVGQEHVVRALSHALDSQRVHHAFLFSGTRGVGKTTIARIFAKSLNCERGVSANPCGECSSCRDIDAGRYADLLEIDAASNTGVDDVRDLIENAQYVPSRGKYKVYLIDEVHMLSKNAFNALLKTLEEPPPHVVFLLATTDPQKLPVTVLSRCLQFNLRRLSEDEIEGQLRRVVEAEGTAHEDDALAELARAGNGSMRDALSLLDQAIAHGGGGLRGADVRGMLGTIARTDVLELARAVSADDASALLASVDRVAEFAPDFGLVMDELARMLHRIALAQALGETRERGEESAAIAGLAAALSHEEAQLLYQLAITGRRDLALAPSPRAGFEMALLRMLTFRRAAVGSDSPEPVRGMPAASAASGGRDAAAAPERSVRSPPPKPYAVATTPPPAVKEPPASQPPAREPPVREPPPREPPERDPPARESAGTRPADGLELTPGAWTALALRLNLRGPARELAHNTSLVGLRGNTLQLAIKPQHDQLRNAGTEGQLREALAPHLGALKLEFRVVADTPAASAADEMRREREARLAAAQSALSEDPVLGALISEFDARLVPGTVRAPQD